MKSSTSELGLRYLQIYTHSLGLFFDSLEFFAITGANIT